MKIFEKKGVETTFVDGAAFNNFAAGNRDGILSGVLDECRLYLVASNIVGLCTGEMIIQGVRVKLDQEIHFSLFATPTQNVSYHIIARVTLSDDVSVEVKLRTTESLMQESLYTQEMGVYEVEIGKFTHDTSGKVVDLERTLKVITGGQNKVLYHHHIRCSGILATWMHSSGGEYQVHFDIYCYKPDKFKNLSAAIPYPQDPVTGEYLDYRYTATGKVVDYSDGSEHLITEVKDGAGNPSAITLDGNQYLFALSDESEQFTDNVFPARTIR